MSSDGSPGRTEMISKCSGLKIDGNLLLSFEIKDLWSGECLMWSNVNGNGFARVLPCNGSKTQQWLLDSFDDDGVKLQQGGISRHLRTTNTCDVIHEGKCVVFKWAN